MKEFAFLSQFIQSEETPLYLSLTPTQRFVVAIKTRDRTIFAGRELAAQFAHALLFSWPEEFDLVIKPNVGSPIIFQARKILSDGDEFKPKEVTRTKIFHLATPPV